jgi:hypothetical protein
LNLCSEGKLEIHHQFRLKLIVRLLLSFFLLLPLQHANAAAETTKKISITAGVEYDSNPSLVEDDPIPVWTYTFAPHLMVDSTDGVNRVFLDSLLLVQRYSNEEVLAAREDPKVRIGWERFYESGYVGITGGYEKTSAIIEELAATGVVTNTGATTTTAILEAKWKHDINSRWSVFTEGGNLNSDYSADAGLGSYNVLAIGSTLTYNYSEKVDAYAKLGYAHYHPNATFENTDFVHLVLGADYEIKDGFVLSPHAGVYNLSGQQSDTSWEAGIIATYTAERMTYAAALNRELAPAGVGGFQKTDSLTAALGYDISERNSIGVGYGLYKSRRDSQIELDWLNFQHIGVFYDHTLSSHWESHFYFDHKMQDLPGVQSHGNVIGVSLVYDTLDF